MKNEYIIDLGQGINLEVVLIQPGEFLMGSTESPEELAHHFDQEPDDFEDEYPLHKVKITRGFWMGKYPVTQAQWQVIVNDNPSYFREGVSGAKYDTSNHPVEKVSWYDFQAFLKKLSQSTGQTFRLPTEAEWEFACRAGSRTHFYWGSNFDEDIMRQFAWYDDNTNNHCWSEPHAEYEGTQAVGQKQPNAWGLYDMCVFR